MPYKGHVENGVIVLDEPTPLKEGERVRVDPADPDTATSEQPGAPLATRLAKVIGKARDLPADWAENHDKYLRDAQ
ncbi:MAG: hypothetical protein HUU46_03420 [Candidatus Hydrogenedentes bacterium]|nr:hypothetical protein [Candidatus Hydrogenedentota bacterium]